MSRGFARFVFVSALVVFGVFFLWPILQILRGGFVDADGRFTLEYVGVVFSDPIYLRCLLNSFLLALATTLTTFTIAMPLAFVADRFLFPGKALLSALVLVPMILPPFVGAIGLRQIFGQYGAFNALLQDLGLLSAGATIDWFAANQFWGSCSCSRSISTRSCTSTSWRRWPTSIQHSRRRRQISAARVSGNSAA